jgi:hypothetical protein
MISWCGMIEVPRWWGQLYIVLRNNQADDRIISQYTTTTLGSCTTMEDYKAKYAIHEACREGQSTHPTNILIPPR